MMIRIVHNKGGVLKTLNKLNKFKNARVIPINGGTIGFYSYFNTKNLNSILQRIYIINYVIKIRKLKKEIIL